MSRRQPISRWGPPTAKPSSSNNTNSSTNSTNSNASSSSGNTAGHAKASTSLHSTRGPPHTQSHHSSHLSPPHHNHNHNYGHGHNHNHNRSYANSHRGGGRHFFPPRGGNNNFHYNRMSSAGRGFNKSRTDSQSTAPSNQNYASKNQALTSSSNNNTAQENHALRPGALSASSNSTNSTAGSTTPTIPDKFRVPPPAGPWNNAKIPVQNTTPNSTATIPKNTSTNITATSSATTTAPTLPPNFRGDVSKPPPPLHSGIIQNSLNQSLSQRFYQKSPRFNSSQPNKLGDINSSATVSHIKTNDDAAITDTTANTNPIATTNSDTAKVPSNNKIVSKPPADEFEGARIQGQPPKTQQLKVQPPSPPQHSSQLPKKKILPGHTHAVLSSVPPPPRHHPPAPPPSLPTTQHPSNSYHRNLTYMRRGSSPERKTSYSNMKSNDNHRYPHGANFATSPKRYTSNNQVYHSHHRNTNMNNHNHSNNEHGYKKPAMPFTKKNPRSFPHHYPHHNDKNFPNKDNTASVADKSTSLSKFNEGIDKNRPPNANTDFNFNKRKIENKDSMRRKPGTLPSSPSRKRYRPTSPSMNHPPHHTSHHISHHHQHIPPPHHPPPHHLHHQHQNQHSQNQPAQQQYHAHNTNASANNDSHIQKQPPPQLPPPPIREVADTQTKASVNLAPSSMSQNPNMSNQNEPTPKSPEVKAKATESSTTQSPTSTITPSSPEAAPPSSSVLALSRYIDASSQMEFAYAKYLYLSQKHEVIKKKLEFVQTLPIGEECFKEDLEALKLNSPNIDLNDLGINLKKSRRSLGSSDRKRRSGTSSSGKDRHSIG